MKEQFSRTALLIGEEAIDRLSASRVAVFGLGGVGGYAAEALARSGVGAIDLIDHDAVSVSNINRQILATHDTVGRLKCDVAAERISSINPDCRTVTHPVFYLPETADLFDLALYDYIIDAVDTVTAKLALITRARDEGIPLISSMGAGNKLDPTAFKVADIYETSVDPLARVMRRECKKRGIASLKVVYSTEAPIHPSESDKIIVREREDLFADDDKNSPPRRDIPGSIAFVPSVAGLILAGEVIKDLIRRTP